MKAWLFPGQDAFSPELGLTLVDDPIGGPLLVRVQERTGVDVTTRAGRRRAARFDTAVVQGILTAVCLTLTARLPRPDVVAGHSLGDLVAWGVASGQAYEDVVDLAITRGTAMAACALEHPGGMVAVDDVEAAIARGGLVRAAHNRADSWVLSGDTAAIRASLGRPVPVLGPWHSPYMAGAQAPLREALDRLPSRSEVDWVSDGEPGGRDRLVEGLVQPVLWWETLLALRARGVDEVVIVGPGRALRAGVREALGIEPQVCQEGA